MKSEKLSSATFNALCESLDSDQVIYKLGRLKVYEGQEQYLDLIHKLEDTFGDYTKYITAGSIDPDKYASYEVLVNFLIDGIGIRAHYNRDTEDKCLMITLKTSGVTELTDEVYNFINKLKN